MRILLLILVAIVQYAHAQPGITGFNSVGSARNLNDSCYLLTPAAGKQVGAVWMRSLDLRKDFTIEAEINLGDRDSTGADGMAFVLQPNSDAVGLMGGGLGYGGLHPSLAIEFDTWQNDDPPYDHIALVKDGVVFHYRQPDFTLQGPFELLPSKGNVEDGKFHAVAITWDAKNINLRCYFDGVLKINYHGDIIKDIFLNDPVVYSGFTGATEGYFNTQQVCFRSTKSSCDGSKIFIPSAFTPNGDHLNDQFYPLGNDPVLVKTMRIFNRWGQIVFEKENFPINEKRYAWDGRFQGSLQPPGLYPYIIMIQCGEGKPIAYKGTISLLR